MEAARQERQAASTLADRLAPALAFLDRLLPSKRAQILRQRVADISRHAAQGEHEPAAILALRSAKEIAHDRRSTDHDDWWFFMRLAAGSAGCCEDDDLKREIVDFAAAGDAYASGHNAARTLLELARWRYEVGDLDAAIAWAERAALADEIWAEPDFMLGWYHLVSGAGEPLGHFARAIGKDPALHAQIAADPLCKEHPRLLLDLQALTGGDRAA